jgi:peptidoglycan/LPS O-acetylase OafA/YrhL
MSIFQVQSIVKDAFATAFYGINYRLAAAGVNYQQATSTPSPLQHFWSLAVEEQFYIIWPLVIGACLLIGRRHHRRLALDAALSIIVASLWFSVAVTRSNPPMAYFAIHTRAWELGVGALCAFGVQWFAKLPRHVAAAASWAGIAGIVYSAFHYNDATPFPGTAALLPVLATALVIAVGSRQRIARWGVERVLALAPVQQVGKLSYAWYLWHWPMLIIVPIAFGYDFNWKLNLQLVALSLWFAVLTLHLLERTTQRGRLRKGVWSTTGVAIAACTVGVALLVSTSLPNLNIGSASAVVGVADSRTLQTQLGSALGIVKLPMNLTPSLGKAIHDVPVSDHDSCHADFLVVTQPACVYGDPKGAHTIALIGDSHAQQWLPALDAEGKVLHWKVVAWTKAACSVADLRLNNDSLHREFSECDSWRKITIGRVKKLNPDMVVISQSDNVPGTQFSNTKWADATATAATQLTSSGLKVVYVLDTPLPKGSGPDCVAQHLTNITKCIRDRNGDSIYAYPGRHEAMRSTLTQTHVTTIDPANWLCTATKCPMIVHNVLVYRDASHMSASYSRFLAPMTAPLFLARKAGA